MAIWGHYKSIDLRILDTFVTKEISIGDDVLSGGEGKKFLITSCPETQQESKIVGMMNMFSGQKSGGHIYRKTDYQP